MNTTTNPNGRERKTLASQIDRLDVMLDGLADGLNDAVAQAVQSAVALAVKEAVQAVLTEILTNPAVLAKLQAAQPAQEQPAEAPAPKEPGRFASWRDWIGTKVKKISERCRAGWQRIRDAGVTLARRAVNTISTVATRARQEAARVVAAGWLLSHFLLRLATALGSGIAIRVALFFTGFVVASSPSDLRALLFATIARTIVWLRRLLAALPWWAAKPSGWQET
jgi:hypothetical protein